jgi:hypothetical protein
MALNEKEKRQYKEWIKKESGYKDKKGRWQKGVTIGDIRRDSGHSNDRETVDISNEITKEEK